MNNLPFVCGTAGELQIYGICANEIEGDILGDIEPVSFLVIESDRYIYCGISSLFTDIHARYTAKIARRRMRRSDVVGIHGAFYHRAIKCVMCRSVFLVDGHNHID